MNELFSCDTKVNGERCGRLAAWVYLSGVDRRRELVCDECRAAYRSARGALSSPPIIEFAMVELLPARSDLLRQVRSLEESLALRTAVALKHRLVAEAKDDWRWRLFGWRGRLNEINQEMGFPEKDDQ